MGELLYRISPLLALIAFGSLLQRRNYFEEVAYSRILQMTLQIAIPCMLFTTFLKMEFHSSYLWVSIFYFFYMLLSLLLGFGIAYVLKIKHRFFPFLLTTFGFGTVGFPLFSTLFGAEQAGYMAVLGIGHEIFVAIVFLPFAQMYLSGDSFSMKNSVKLLKNPFLLMVGLAIGLRLTSLDVLLTNNFIGIGIAGAIEYIGGITLVLALIMVGYRIKFSDSGTLATSFYYAFLRLIATVGLGLLLQVLVANKLMNHNPYFIHAYHLLMFQHSSLSLTALVGQYGTLEEQQLINNTFAINLLLGFVLTVGYMALFLS